MTSDEFVECPHPLCDGGVIVTGQYGTAGTDSDEICSLCMGFAGFDTHDEIDDAWRRIGCCHLCHEVLEDCHCPIALPPVRRQHLALVAEQPSPRERREHGRVLTFPTKHDSRPLPRPAA